MNEHSGSIEYERVERGLQATIDLLTRREQAAQRPQAAARERVFRHRAEAILEQHRTSREREGLIPCPACGHWSELWDETEQVLRCPTCGDRTEFPTLYAFTGIWGLHLVYILLFTGLALVFGRIGFSPALALPPRLMAGVAALFFAMLSLPYWRYCVWQAIWYLGRGRGSAREERLMWRLRRWIAAGRQGDTRRFGAAIEVSNDQDAPQVVYVEPWGSDYTLLPQEKLQVVAFGSTRTPWFTFAEADDAIQVYCEDADDFQVYQDGKLLECGHQRGVQARVVS
jgi:hypothetical protein